MRMEFRIVGSYSGLRFAGSLMSSGPHAGTLFPHSYARA